jgi:hypothetical protein
MVSAMTDAHIREDEPGPAGDLKQPRVSGKAWPSRPLSFPTLLTPVEAAMYLRLDETGDHTPASAVRTLNY